MHNFVSFNQQILSASATNLSAISSAVFYGKGIFTTLAIYHSKPFLWEKHWLRVFENAQKIGLDLTDFPEESVSHSVAEIIRRNFLINGRARLTFFDEQPGRVWSFPTIKKTSLLITTADFRETAEINLTLSPYHLSSTSPLANVKSCNYLENLMAFEEAGRRGFNEAVRLNERREIVSACLANIFWLKNEEILTPALETGCLAGTTRGFILENFPVQQISAGLADLAEADEIFLTSAGLGIAGVRTFGERVFEHSDKFFQLDDFFRAFVLKNQSIP